MVDGYPEFDFTVKIVRFENIALSKNRGLKIQLPALGFVQRRKRATAKCKAAIFRPTCRRKPAHRGL
jgi:hypothetical protein